MEVKYIIEKERGEWYVDKSLNTNDLLNARLFTKDEAVGVLTNATVFRIILLSVEAKEFYDELGEEVNFIDYTIWGNERPWVLYLDELVNFVKDECNDIMNDVISRHSTFGDAIKECAERVVQRYKKIKK